jgi:ketosteroid isomerase-like protein
MSEPSGLAGVVEGAYAALDAGDIEAFLAFFAADAFVRYPADGKLPYGGTWRGHQEIGRFLDVHDETEEIVVFDVQTVETAGEWVFARGRFVGRTRRTGVEWTTEFIHTFHVRRGVIVEWDAFFDTAAAMEAHRA